MGHIRPRSQVQPFVGAPNDVKRRKILSYFFHCIKVEITKRRLKYSSVKKTFCEWTGHQEANAYGTGTTSTNGDVTRVSIEKGNILVYPLECLYLIINTSQVSFSLKPRVTEISIAELWVSQETKRSQSVIQAHKNEGIFSRKFFWVGTDVSKVGFFCTLSSGWSSIQG